MKARTALTACVLMLALTGCGPELERISELEGLRVLGVQKDAPYAEPETDVEFRLLWEDAAEETPRETERFWIGGCNNPPGDLYSGCFVQWLQALGEAAEGEGEDAGDPSGFFGQGDRFVTKSAPIRETPPPPGQPRYGLGYVFFGVCAGQLDWEGWAERLQEGEVRDLSSALPYCLDRETGDRAAAGDYVVGYSSVYSYAEDRYRNANPVIGDGDDGALFQVNGVDVEHDCVGEGCVCPAVDPSDPDPEPCQTPFPVPDLTGCEPGVACIDACAADGDVSCPEVDLRPVLLPELNVEPNVIAQESFGRNIEESMWISYFVDRGSVSSDLRLLNDGELGWNSDYSTKLYAPREPGPLRIWAVVRDNRGGSNWVRIPAYVR